MDSFDGTAWRLPLKETAMYLRGTTIAGLLFALGTGSAKAAVNLFVNGNFESGNTGFSTDYTYNSTSSTSHANGDVDVVTAPSLAPYAYPDWGSYGDHTTGSGLMLAVNGPNNAGENVWAETVAVTPNTNYTFTFFGADIANFSSDPAVVQEDVNGVQLGTSALLLGGAQGVWTPLSQTYSSGSATSATFSIIDQTLGFPYNDFSLDDISITAVPEPASLSFILLAAPFLGRRRR